MREFDMIDLGCMNYFLGIEVLQKKEGIFIYQKGLKIHNDAEGVPVDETYYKQIVGSFMYLTSTRPDLMYATSLLSRYMAKPLCFICKLQKKVLRYLKGTMNLGIFYKKESQPEELETYTDIDYVSDSDDRKSTSGYAFLLSSGVVAWSSKKQPIVILSTTEAEFVATTVCVCQAIWIKRILKVMIYERKSCTNIKCDSSSTSQVIQKSSYVWSQQAYRCSFSLLKGFIRIRNYLISSLCKC
ncbi:secreted RxLR effector protein 161-like [Impatiens glandulifera]|uniref:secreted RxLR effector protein 161-like n=1 Tax=Impatiens glandulifera TaxID=253017 RepID=UPI001FB06F9C|nr:secreted RxLR effector protein 161-like [Impatiens glandulifera]